MFAVNYRFSCFYDHLLFKHYYVPMASHDSLQSEIVEKKIVPIFFMNEYFSNGSRSSLLWITIKVFPMKGNGYLIHKGAEHYFISPSTFLNHKNRNGFSVLYPFKTC